MQVRSELSSDRSRAAPSGGGSEQNNSFGSSDRTCSFIDRLCEQAISLQLRPQQRVPTPNAAQVIFVRNGMLAVDAKPAKDRLQVLDFLLPGDVVSGPSVLPGGAMSLRAITSSSVVLLNPPCDNQEIPTDLYCNFLGAASASRLARAHIHQLMIGRLETEQRVASFLYSLALRTARAGLAVVELPMSRTDVANYLVINMDTLSRTMMKFCSWGLIKRESRHSIRIIDRDGLAAKSPLSRLLQAHSAQGDVKVAKPLARMKGDGSALAGHLPLQPFQADCGVNFQAGG